MSVFKRRSGMTKQLKTRSLAKCSCMMTVTRKRMVDMKARYMSMTSRFQSQASIRSMTTQMALNALTS